MASAYGRAKSCGDLRHKIETHAKERVIRDDKNIDQVKKDKETYEEKEKVMENSITSGSLNQKRGSLKDVLGKRFKKVNKQSTPESTWLSKFCRSNDIPEDVMDVLARNQIISKSFLAAITEQDLADMGFVVGHKILLRRVISRLRQEGEDPQEDRVAITSKESDLEEEHSKLKAEFSTSTPTQDFQNYEAATTSSATTPAATTSPAAPNANTSPEDGVILARNSKRIQKRESQAPVDGFLEQHGKSRGEFGSRDGKASHGDLQDKIETHTTFEEKKKFFENASGSLKQNGRTLKDARGGAISVKKEKQKRESFSQAPVGGLSVQCGKSRGELASHDGKASHRPIQNEAFYKKDVNILILGETGVGKSTWINGIANYAKHNSLQDAMDHPEFTVLIPSRFVFTDEVGEEKEITFGTDTNEDLSKAGQSATQFPREYMFETDTKKFHLIDTPGVGDSRGIEQDKENFENILAFLTCYDKINAVVVLLKPNNARLTVAFRFCVLELLTHLHKSLVSNIIFAFTNSRGTFYRPGDSLPVLKRLLKERNIEISLSPSNYFCFDNEAFRFLACSNHGIEFTDEDVQLFSKSWEKSCDTTRKLFDLVTKMKPHETKKTLSLNEARSCIVAMSKPMGQAVQLIEINVREISIVKDKCKLLDEDIESFKKDLKFKAFDLKRHQLGHPITVCADEKCKKYVNVGKTRQRNTIYEQVCHDHCYLSGVPVETTNNEQLRRCRAMRSDGNCNECEHDYTFHMHMTYTTTLEEKEFLSDDVQNKIKKNSDLKSKRELLKEELERKIKELEDEKEVIFECASYFGVFLKENAMIAYNDSFSEYLDMLIREEEAKEKKFRDQKKIDKMKEQRRTYEAKKEVIRKNIASGSKDKNEIITTAQIQEMRMRLCSLEHNGETLREALDDVISAKQMRHNAARKTVDVSQVKPKSSSGVISTAYNYVKSKVFSSY